MSGEKQNQPVRYLLGALKNPRHPRFAHLLFLAPTPLLLGLLVGSPYFRVAALVVFVLVGLAVWLLRQGVRAQLAYDAAQSARRPRLPLKLFGAVFIGLAMAFLSLRPDWSGLDLALPGLTATVLALVAFGPDPLKHKGIDAPGAGDRMRADEAVQRARGKLEAIGRKIGLLADPELDAGFARLDVAASHLFDAMQGDPARQRSLRKHVGVFIDAATEATDRFSVIYRGTRDAETKSRYLAMIDDLAQQFEARARRYLLDGKGALDVEIDVLQSRLHDTAT